MPFMNIYGMVELASSLICQSSCLPMKFEGILETKKKQSMNVVFVFCISVFVVSSGWNHGRFTWTAIFVLGWIFLGFVVTVIYQIPILNTTLKNVF